MTTNVFDANVPKLASDSRWSIDSEGGSIAASHNPFVIYIDDTGFDKIEFSTTLDAALMFAGNAALIQDWKNWLRGNPLRIPHPNTDGVVGFSVCVVDMIDATVIHESRQGHTLPQARFAGSGGTAAYDCWLANKEPCRAVHSAIAADMYSGGTVMFLNLKTKDHNLVNSADLAQVASQIQIEGYVMYKQAQNTPIPVSTAASNDPNVRSILNGIATGSITPCAPFDGMDVPWTKEESTALNAALDKLIRRKLASTDS